jgi:hypothetical protein
MDRNSLVMLLIMLRFTMELAASRDNTPQVTARQSVCCGSMRPSLLETLAVRTAIPFCTDRQSDIQRSCG